ncbi:MAG TPA: HD domain-containing protein [Thermoplasmata archaeon]|nr:HD domain-containing protein [Thermoplasmata archaeon]
MKARSGRGPRKSIYDPVHGPISLQGSAVELVGHPAFQRLWGIRQTGLAHLVFPGANHTRLEHSLGVFWVAGAMGERLGLAEPHLELVRLGGLLHDLGHGPFSHTLDGAMHEVLGIGHEEVSRRWITGAGPDPVATAPTTSETIPSILERHGVRPAHVAELVDRGRGRLPPLLRGILHGPVDADRLDYLQRDAHYTGVAHGAIDAVRLLDTLESDGRHLVFAEKGRSALEGFLLGRALMYNSVYYHKTVRAAEVMLSGAVERLGGYPDSAAPLFYLTDGDLFSELARAGDVSRGLVTALRERRLYKRAAGWREAPSGRRRSLTRLIDDPPARRQIEAELAQLIGAPDGHVLIDLSGLLPREPGARDLREIAVREDGRVRHPFAQSPHWRSLLLRPPSSWAVGVYAHPRWRHAAEERLPRALSRYV